MIYTPNITNNEYGVSDWTTTFGKVWNDVSGATGMANINSQEAEKQRAWEKMMSDTSYQRAIEDMKKAGLNPALMFGNGSGASTPSGAAASARGGSPDLEVLTKAARLMDAVTNARMADKYTGKNEFSDKTAYNLYEKASKFTSYQGRPKEEILKNFKFDSFDDPNDI